LCTLLIPVQNRQFPEGSQPGATLIVTPLRVTAYHSVVGYKLLLKLFVFKVIIKYKLNSNAHEVTAYLLIVDIIFHLELLGL